jgi:hypothetical protein
MKISRFEHWMLLAAAVVFMLSGWHKVAKTVQPFPASSTVAGWEKTDETRTFNAANLWQYIDGDSEQYVKAGVVSTATSAYKYQGKLEATLDVYTMTNTDGAKTIFEMDPLANSKAAQIGDAAHVYGQSVIFRKGEYLVRIVAYQSGPETQDALVALAHGVETRI